VLRIVAKRNVPGLSQLINDPLNRLAGKPHFASNLGDGYRPSCDLESAENLPPSARQVEITRQPIAFGQQCSICPKDLNDEPSERIYAGIGQIIHDSILPY
jgi:hypothetical protein